MKHLLPVVLGFSDGVLTALTLAASLFTDSLSSVTLSLAARIASASSLSGAFVFFVARYAELRHELVRAERQLNLTTHGRLAAGRLGTKSLREAAGAAVISSIAAFCGSLLPLLVASMFPGYRWSAIATALGALAALGAGLARAIHGSAVRWSVTLVIGGAILLLVGVHLKIL